ncbi:MAG: HAMP domain-containing histidine kinase, partial [Lachnospiraceae bacterium]|nr:HAMP domain-containing histidine kinase [Lachnospiraceae bacterium]
MFKQSKRKIIAAIMGILVLFMSLILLSVYSVSFMQAERQNREMLEQYAARYVLEEAGREDRQDGIWPGGQRPDDGMRPDDGRKFPDERAFMASTFYSAAFSGTGEVLAVENRNKAFQSDDEVVARAKEILGSGQSSGKSDDLMFSVTEKDGYTLVAFINVAVTRGNMDILLRQILITGGVATVAIFFVARFLAQRIIRPLEENDRRQKQFVSDAGHELKTPVAVISANAELLARTAGESEWLSNIRHETERMGDLVTQLLDLSRAENAETVMEALDFSRLVAGEALPFESVAFEAGLEIRTDIEEDVEVEGNRAQLAQLTSILLDNAVRHSEGGKEILLKLNREHRQAVLSVENSGQAIDPETRDKLF